MAITATAAAAATVALTEDDITSIDLETTHAIACPGTFGLAQINYAFVFNCPSFALMKARMSSDIPKSLSHCSL
jgi:hypothetical protein